MPRRGENIYKRKDGRWEGRLIKEYFPDGKASYQSVYGHTYQEVKTLLRELSVNNHPAMTRSARTLTFSEATTQWLLHQQIRVKPSTYSAYCGIVKRHLLPEFGRRACCRITAAEIDAFITRKLRSGRKDGLGGLSPKTTRDIISILKMIFLYTEREYGLPTPCKNTSLPVLPPLHTRVFDPKERSLLYRSLNENLTPETAGILLSLLTGMRLGEICALKWSCINWKEHLLYVRATVQRIQHFSGKGPKTSLISGLPKSRTSLRSIPVTPSLNAILKRLKTMEEKSYTGNLLFDDTYILTGTEFCLDPRRLQYIFKTQIEHLGIENANFHCLRHTFASDDTFAA